MSSECNKCRMLQFIYANVTSIIELSRIVITYCSNREYFCAK